MNQKYKLNSTITHTGDLDNSDLIRIKNSYGSLTARILKAFQNNWSNNRITKVYGISKASLAAYKANFTRGTYTNY